MLPLYLVSLDLMNVEVMRGLQADLEATVVDHADRQLSLTLTCMYTYVQVHVPT